jgi:polyisoprenoid-binding protein YceI
VSRRSISLSWALLLLLASAPAALAQPMQYRIDPGHSLVGFSIRHFFSRTSGRFKDFAGTIQYDAKNLAASSVDVTIQTNSLDTANERRDGDLRGSNFFNVDTFPTMTFKSTKVVPGQGDKFQIMGDLTLRGVTKPVTLDASLLGSGDIGMNGRTSKRAGFEATTKIDRKDFGIVWNRTLDQGGTMLGDDVNITLQMEAVWMDPNAPPPPAPGQKPAAAPAPEKK